MVNDIFRNQFLPITHWPGIMELLKSVRSHVAHEIRRMPDFVMQNPTSKEVYFMEVKFQASVEFKRKDFQKNYP